MIKFKYVFILLALGLISCFSKNNEKPKLNTSQKIIIKKAVNTFFEKEGIANDTFMVNPYFGSFEFDSFLLRNDNTAKSKSKNKTKILSKFNWNESYFIDIQSNINEKYEEAFSEDLINLSQGEESNYIFTFSGFQENLVFMEVTHSCKKIDKKKLSKGFDNIREPKWRVFSFVVEINGEEITDILLDNSAVFELQCDSEDVY